MSGYPYGNPGGGYPPQYGGGGYNSGNNFQQPPPPMPNYNDNQSCASLYGTAGPYDSYGGNQMSNPPYGGGSYPPPSGAPYDPYGGSSMPNASYGMGGGSSYPPPPQQPYGGQMPYPAATAPPPPQQQFGGIISGELNSIVHFSYNRLWRFTISTLFLSSTTTTTTSTFNRWNVSQSTRTP